MTTPPGYLLPRRATLLALAGVLLGMMLAVLNQTIVATALPRIVEDLGGAEHYSWVFSAYMLALTISAPIYGKLSDMYGRRRFFVAGLVIFMGGAVIAASAGSMMQLVLGRGVQGLGAGALVPMAMAVIGDLIPASERGRWQGLTGAVFGVASILGPVTGGAIADNADWRWVFLVSLPLGILALVVVSLTLKLPPRPPAEHRIDYEGASLLVAGLSTGLLAAVWGGQEYAWGSTTIVGMFAASVVILAVFIWHEHRALEPIVPIELFRQRLVWAGSLAGFTVGVGMFAAIMFVPLFVQGVLGSSATSSGLVLTPLMLAFVTASVGSGQIITRTGRYRWALLLGPLITGAGFVLLAGLDVDSTTRDATIGMIVVGFGLGLLLQNLILAMQNGVPRRHLGAVTAASQFTRGMGALIGVTAAGAILSANLQGGSGGGVSAALSPTGGGGTAALELADAIHPVFVFGIPLMVVSFLLVWLIPQLPLRRSVHDGDAELAPEAEPERAATYAALGSST